MRPILVGLLAAFFIGTVWSYARISDWLTPTQPAYHFQVASGDYSIHLTTSYDLSNTEDHQTLVRLNGEKILASSDRIEAGVALRVTNLPIRVGENYLYVEVAAPKKDAQQQLDNAANFLLGGEEDETRRKTEFQFVRVQIFRDGIPVKNGDVTTHLDSRDSAITELFFSAFESNKTTLDH